MKRLYTITLGCESDYEAALPTVEQIAKVMAYSTISEALHAALQTELDPDLNFTLHVEDEHLDLQRMPSTCQCADPKCSVHVGHAECWLPGSFHVFLTEEVDNSGLFMCNACAQDAMESGQYDTRDEEPDLYEGRDQC